MMQIKAKMWISMEFSAKCGFHMISHDLTCGFKKRWPEKKHKTSGFDPHTFLGSKPKIGILNFHQDGIMLYWDS
jgi:hypothetical protein